MQISSMILDSPQQSSDRLRRQNVRTAADVGREDLERVLRVRDVPESIFFFSFAPVSSKAMDTLHV